MRAFIRTKIVVAKSKVRFARKTNLGSNSAWLSFEVRHFAQVFRSGNTQDSFTILQLLEVFPEKKNWENGRDLATLAVIVMEGGYLVSHQTIPTWLPSRPLIVDESKPTRLI